MRSVQFKNRNINMAGNLYLPNGFKESEQYPAIVCVHPGGGVKEQTAGVYAQRLADQGRGEMSSVERRKELTRPLFPDGEKEGRQTRAGVATAKERVESHKERSLSPLEFFVWRGVER